METARLSVSGQADVAALVAAIKLAVAVAGSRPGSLLDSTIRANASQSRDQIVASHELEKPLHDGKLKVVTGYHSLDTGAVTLD